MAIVQQFFRNLRKRPLSWKRAWMIAAVLSVFVAFKTTLLGNAIMVGCWLVWAWSIYGDWENK